MVQKIMKKCTAHLNRVQKSGADDVKQCNLAVKNRSGQQKLQAAFAKSEKEAYICSAL